jgi:hypothetical protein
MKYLLIVFFFTSVWPLSSKIDSGQYGPFNNILACEHAAKQAEMIAKSIGVEKVGTFCAPTTERLVQLP